MASTSGDGPARPASDGEPDDVTLSGDEWPVPPEYRATRLSGREAPPAEPVPAEQVTEPIHQVTEPIHPAAAPPRRTNPVTLALAVLILLLALAAGAFALGLLGDSAEESAGARATASAPGQGAAPPATTTEADPAGARPADRQVATPELVGMRVAEARRRLDVMGLEASLREIASERPAGEVVRQVPDPGREVDRGSTVTLVASSGPELSAVPEVVGLSRDRATAALREAGLAADVRTRPSSRPAGTVLEQDPAAGEKVDPGSSVRLVVAVEPEPARVTVPGVVGLSLAEARARLAERGLRSTVTRVESSRPAGTVVRQAPGGGTSSIEGSVVRLTVSSGPSLVSVPDVVGLDEAGARAELEGAGFTVRVAEQPTSDPAQDGVVVAQSPVGGAQAREGATVTITVALYT